MYRGYVKIWRKSLDSGWLKNHKLWVFWSWCLLKASHKEYDQIIGYQTVHLMPGQFIFGRSKASEELALSQRSIRTIINFLRNSQNVTIKTTNKFSVISIVNWDAYQTEEKQNDQQNDKPLTNKRPATDQPLTTNKNEKNEKNEKNRERRFTPPTKMEVTEYCLERHNMISAEKFVDYYESIGWMVGKSKMKDWKAAVRTWEKRDKDNHNQAENELMKWAKEG